MLGLSRASRSASQRLLANHAARAPTSFLLASSQSAINGAMLTKPPVRSMSLDVPDEIKKLR